MPVTAAIPVEKEPGRPVRINPRNEIRDAGSEIKNLGRAWEDMENSLAIQCFSTHFFELAPFHLDRKLELPFNSRCRFWGKNKSISHPTPHTTVVTDSQRT